MGTPRDLVELLQAVVKSGLDPFGPAAPAAILRASGDLPRRVLDEIRQAPGDLAVLLCLRALAVQRSELAPRLLDPEFVVTLPQEVRSSARSTGLVIREMLEGPHEEVFALGYEISDDWVIAQLQEASARGVKVTLVCDRGKGSGARLLQEWPAHVQGPTIYADRERVDAPPHASMHGKALLVDGTDLLVTSANFTFHGLRGNIEFGVRLRGAAAGEAREIFRQILASEILERLERS